MVKPCRHIFGLAFLLATLSVPTAAQTLAKAEFDAIVAEAVQIYKQDSHSKSGNPPHAWRTLDRDKLARLLQMPEFAALDNVPKGPLIDQAGAWNLMPFDSPAAALAQWEKWLPEEAGKPVTPEARDAPRPHAYYADYRWAPEASANVALMHCYPTPAWYVRYEEPMLWAMEHGGGWDQPNAFDFRQCVLQQGDEGAPAWPNGKETPRGKASAAILERVFSRYLLANGCKGEGPNRCLPMLHALRSLNPKHESLVPILKAIEPGFALGENIAIHEAIPGRRDENLESAYGMARQAMRKLFFLTAKIPVLLDRPKEWPAGAIEQTVRQVLDLTQTLHISYRLSEGRRLLEIDDYDSKFFAAPWHALTPAGIMPAAVGDALRKLGRERAQSPGCGLAEMGIREIPAVFWLAYAEEKLAREQTSCGALAENTDAAKRYGEAVAKNDASLLAPIAGLKPFIDGGGATRKELVDLLAANCPPVLKAGQKDPWLVCRLAAADRAQEEARRKAAEPPPPPPACSADLPARVAQGLGYLERPGREACKPIPNAPGKSIVALSYLAQGLEDGAADSDDMGSYDLDVLVVDSGTGRVRSRLLIEKAYESDAVRYQGAEIDTARYRLSPKVRAFGLRAGHSINSHAGAYDENELSLFVEDGSRLRRVLKDLLVYRYSGEALGECAGNYTKVERTVAIAPTRSNDFADLLVTTTTTDIENRPAGDDCAEVAKAPVVSQTTLHYDGKTYPVPHELR